MTSPEGRPSAATPLRSVRVPTDIWEAAQREADRRGETVSAVIVRALRRYGRTAVVTTTLRAMAAEQGMQTYELAALLDLGRAYDETAEIDSATAADYLEAVRMAREAAEQ